MSKQPIEGYITFKKAADTYQVSYRQLGTARDDARGKNPKISRNFRVATSDGEVFENEQVSAEFVRRLSTKEKRNPTWYVRVKWLDDAYQEKPQGAEKGSAQGDSQQPLPPPGNTPSLDQQAIDAALRIARTEWQNAHEKEVQRLEAQMTDLQTEREAMRGQMEKALDRSQEDKRLFAQAASTFTKVLNNPSFVKALAAQNEQTATIDTSGNSSSPPSREATSRQSTTGKARPNKPRPKGWRRLFKRQK